MSYAVFRSMLLAGAAGAVLCGVVEPASAVTTLGPPASDFGLLESISGNSGTFTVFNNTTDWYVWGFSVGNPSAGSQNEFPATTQTNWSSSKSCVEFGSSQCTAAFEYLNANRSSTESTDLANDIGPDSSSDNFTFGALVAASPAQIQIVNAAGTTLIENLNATDAVPEPASMAMLGVGILGLWGARRRQKRQP